MRLPLLVHLLLPGLFSLGLAAQVAITARKDRVSVDVNGQPFTSLFMGQEAHKPYLYPLTTASGRKVTRGFPVEPAPGDPTDHPHQRGLWAGAERVTVAGLGLMDFWENDPSYKRPHMGTIVFRDVVHSNSGPTEGSFTFVAHWLSPDGVPVIAETRTLTFYSGPKDCRMFDVDLRLRAQRSLTFEDYDDAVIGIRLSPLFDEKNGGRPVNAQNLVGETGIRGKRSEWIDWQANVDGEVVGVALMDHPSNFSFPTRWHVRSVGLIIASPFARHDFLPEAPVLGKSLAAGEELHLRYRVLIHPRTTEVNKIWQEFAAR